MSILLSAHELSKSFGMRALFTDLSLTIESGERIGLIGPNGAGKSTLLRILAQQISPDEGELSFERGLKVGFLEQVPEFSTGATIFSSVMEGIADPEDWTQVGLVHEFISRFLLDQFGEEAPIESLSGGWKKRVALARELVKKPDLLLLDEPTNHLDIDGILWLEEFLSRAPFAVLTITHDRVFLQRVANRIIELDRRHAGGLLSIRGDYTDYLEARELLISAQERREVILKNTLRRETEWLRQGAKARTTKQQARIDRAGELKDQVEALTDRNQSRTARIDFQSAERNPKKLIQAEKISKSYGDRVIFTDLDLMVGPKSRIGLLGPNGAGKSTLIRTLIGEEKPTSGKIERSERLSVAYFDQTRETLDPDLSLAQVLNAEGDHVEFGGRKIHIRSYLDRFLFTQDQMSLPVGKLSGGEQSRLLIARLMLTQANLLVLDEPTNDLDMATLNVLEDCLVEFAGAVILVTHDRYFLGRVANQLLAFPNSSKNHKLLFFSDLYQWESWHRDQAKEGKKSEKSKSAPQADVLPASESKRRKLSYKEERELKTIEPRIHEAELKLAQLTEESTLPQNRSNAKRLGELTEEMANLQLEIDRMYERWAELSGEA